MRRFHGIVFDKDGTLFDFSSTWAAWAQAVLARISQDEAEALRLGRAIGFDLETGRFDPASVVIAGTPAEVTAVLGPMLDPARAEDILDILVVEAETAPQVEAAPLVPLLSGLRAEGLRLGLATNDAEAAARAHLGRAGVTDLFDFVAGFDSGHGAKPGPGQLAAFAGAVALAPGDVLMVGDSLHDLAAARAAGMSAVAVLTGIAPAAELAPHALAVLPDIGHLPAWLARQNPAGA